MRKGFWIGFTATAAVLIVALAAWVLSSAPIRPTFEFSIGVSHDLK